MKTSKFTEEQITIITSARTAAWRACRRPNSERAATLSLTAIGFKPHML